MMRLNKDEREVLAELLFYDESTAKELKQRKFCNPSTHLKSLERRGLVRIRRDFEGFHYRPIKSKLFKEGILKKAKKPFLYTMEMGKIKPFFRLGIDVPTEKNLMSLFKGLDEIREKNYGLWKQLMKLIVKSMNHCFVDTEDGFLTEKQSIEKKKELDRLEEELTS